MTSEVTLTDHGFTWDHCSVERLSSIVRSNGRYVCLRVNDLEIYVSPAGRTRVFRGGIELKQCEVSGGFRRA